MHRHSEVHPDRSLRQGRLSAVSLVLVVYGVVGWYATRALPLSVSAAPSDPVMSFSLLPEASPDSGLSGALTRASTTAEPESKSEPVKPIHRQSTRQQSTRQQSPRQQSPRQQSVSGVNAAGAVTPESDAFPRALSNASNTSSSGTVVVSHLDYDGPPPRPVYPQHALRARQQGLVVIRVVIGKDGSVLRADVSQSSGFELLDAAAVSASLRTKFHPYSRNGIAFSASADLPFNFVVKP